MGVQTVGASVRRMEDPRLLRGEGAYVDDIRIPGVLHMAVVDAYAAIQPGAPVLHDNAPDNVAATLLYESGDVDAAFATAERVVRERLDMQRYTGIPMETRGVVASRDAVTGELTVWASTQ